MRTAKDAYTTARSRQAQKPVTTYLTQGGADLALPAAAAPSGRRRVVGVAHSFCKTPSRVGEHIRVRILCHVPVMDGYAPKVGAIYDAIRGEKQLFRQRGPFSEFCVVEVNGKKIVLRRGYRYDDEYEEVEA